MAATPAFPTMATPKCRGGPRSRASPRPRRSTTFPEPPAINTLCNPSSPVWAPHPTIPQTFQARRGRTPVAAAFVLSLRGFPAGTAPRGPGSVPPVTDTHTEPRPCCRPARLPRRTPSPGCDTGAPQPRWALPAATGPGCAAFPPFALRTHPSASISPLVPPAIPPFCPLPRPLPGPAVPPAPNLCTPAGPRRARAFGGERRLCRGAGGGPARPGSARPWHGSPGAPLSRGAAKNYREDKGNEPGPGPRRAGRRPRTPRTPRTRGVSARCSHERGQRRSPGTANPAVPASTARAAPERLTLPRWWRLCWRKK